MQIRISDLSVARGGIPVLQGVDFACSAGQALVMRGPNGIGKTTLLRTLAGLQPALSGTIDAPEDSIAYAAHSDGIKATLTVRENLEFWAAVFGSIDIGPALTAFDLNGLIDRAAGALSAGQKRRLGLARLLVTGRPIWILDEPTVSLDVDAVQLFANTVRAHLGGGGIAIIATHIDLGLDADILQIAPFKATAPNDDMLDEAFL